MQIYSKFIVKSIIVAFDCQEVLNRDIWVNERNVDNICQFVWNYVLFHGLILLTGESANRNNDVTLYILTVIPH